MATHPKKPAQASLYIYDYSMEFKLPDYWQYAEARNCLNNVKGKQLQNTLKKSVSMLN